MRGAGSEIHPDMEPPSAFDGAVGYQTMAGREPDGWTAVTAAAPPMRPAPLPKRPKGRLLAGALLTALCAFAVYGVWDSFFRYRAYGTVAGRLIDLSSAVDGAVRFYYVNEGDTVHQGQLLLVLDNVVMRERLAQLEDEVRLAEADRAAELSRLKWQLLVSQDGRQRALSDYYETWGRLLQERAKLEVLARTLERSELLVQRDAQSQQELDEVRFSEQGQREMVAKLAVAVDEQKRRADLATDATGDGFEQLRPKMIKIETLLSEMRRLRERLAEGQIRAPIDGLVVKRFRFTGENAAAREPLMSILEAGSLQVVLYVPQLLSKSFAPGDEITVVVDPHPERISCRVDRLGDQFEGAPESLQVYYRRNQSLLPVYLRPDPTAAAPMALRLGCLVKLP
jgi:multidrug resistance efflux pump